MRDVDSWFVIRRQVVGMNWIEIPARRYKLLSEEAKRSTCQIELNVRYGGMRFIELTVAKHAPKVGRFHLVRS